MKIYLIKTAEYSIQDFLYVKAILNSQSGPMVFEEDLIDFTNDFKFLQWFDENFQFKNVKPSKRTIYDSERGNPLSWREFFDVCNRFRTVKNISDDNFVILLTSRRNSLNWFSSFEQGKRNIFVHTGDWENYIKAHHKYPVAYEVISNILCVLYKCNLDKIDEYLHISPIGCISDLCERKSEVILKLRTGDICQTCLDRLVKENVEPALINQAIYLLESIRKQTLFRQDFPKNKNLSRLIVTNDYSILLEDYGNIEIQLPPLHKALYLLYLKHPEGIKYNEITDYKQQLKDLYFSISPNSNLSELNNSVERLCDPLDGSIREKCAYIKKEIKTKIGESDLKLVELYCIMGDRNAPKRISLDRKLVSTYY